MSGRCCAVRTESETSDADSVRYANVSNERLVDFIWVELILQ